jgi:hypothetical protein
MHLTTFGLLAITSLVLAAPLEDRNYHVGDRGAYVSAWNAGQPAQSQSYAPAPSAGAWSPPSGAPSGAAGGAPAAPTEVSSKPFALSNGFPNVKNPSSQLTDIFLDAQGTLPNGPPPAKAPSTETVNSLRLVAFNEIWEVFFFTQLLSNVTNGVPGYQFQDGAFKDKVVKILTTIIAQEELHALNANGALAHFNAGPIQACEYNAPVDNFHDAIALASTFTDVVMGTLADVNVVS